MTQEQDAGSGQHTGTGNAQGTAAATNGKQTQDRLAEGFLENEFADDQQAQIQEQDAGESQHTGTGHTDAQGTAAANAGKQTQDSLAAGILALVRFSLVTISDNATEDISSDNAMTDFSTLTAGGGYFAGGSKEVLGRIYQVYFGDDTKRCGTFYCLLCN